VARLTRRAVTHGLGAALAAPFLIRPAAAADFDVIVIGAGAAGLAAARKLTAAKKRVAVLEAGDRVGGRCFTEMRTFQRPYEQGAHWLHESEKFPLARLAEAAGLTLDKRAPNSQLRIPNLRGVRPRAGAFRPARESEAEEFYAGLVRSTRAIAEVAEINGNCSEALPLDLREWRETVEFLLGPYTCGADLRDMQPREFIVFEKPDHSMRVREGAGTLMRHLALGLPIQYFSAVTRIVWSAQGVEVETSRQKFSATAAILTVPAGVLAAGSIAFSPALPARHAEAVGRLKPGTVERVTLQFDPTALPADQLYIEQAENRRTAAGHINFFGSGLCHVQVGGSHARALAAEGEVALLAFATEWMANHFGADITRVVRQTHVTRWGSEPFTRGAFSYAAPQTGAARKTLSAPLGERLWFAGEAVHETMWGTVAGAWESGERAAEAAIGKKSG